jgi:hypothetical protein
MRSDRQPVATDGNGLRLISRRGDLRTVATGCNHGLHKGSILNENRHTSERGVEVLFAVLPFSQLGPARAEVLRAELAAVPAPLVGSKASDRSLDGSRLLRPRLRRGCA